MQVRDLGAIVVRAANIGSQVPVCHVHSWCVAIAQQAGAHWLVVVVVVD